MIKFFAALFSVEDENVDRASEEIARNSLVGHTLLIIPVFGGMAPKYCGFNSPLCGIA